jgi:hypothetical protein
MMTERRHAEQVDHLPALDIERQRRRRGRRLLALELFENAVGDVEAL